MKRPDAQDSSVLLVLLFGIDDAKVLKFAEDEESGAFGILFVEPMLE
jgi:hypothetical protein